MLRRGDEHAWLQSAGWIGLVVGGMGLRLVPRLGGRPPLPLALPVTVLVLMVAGLVVRPLYAAGALVLAAALAGALATGRRGDPWWWAAVAGTAWWLRAAWLVFTGAPVEAIGWALIAGVGLSFAWAVQSRMVHVFFGRPPRPALVLALLAAFEAGAAFAPALAGAATVGLAVVAGSVWGEPRRMSTRARGAGRGILLANRLAVVGGLLLVASALRTFGWARDAGVHVLGLGFLSVLIVAMAIVLAPVFALERTGREGAGPERLAPWLLAAAALVRAVAAPTLAEPALIAAGVLAWIGLGLFAHALGRALVTGPSLRAALRPPPTA